MICAIVHPKNDKNRAPAFKPELHMFLVAAAISRHAISRHGGILSFQHIPAQSFKHILANAA